MAEDEPACDKLRTENEQITAYLMSGKEKQLDLLANIKALKEEKNNAAMKLFNSLSKAFNKANFQVGVASYASTRCVDEFYQI